MIKTIGKAVRANGKAIKTISGAVKLSVVVWVIGEMVKASGK